MRSTSPKASLLCDIPSDRYRVFGEQTTPPKKGDIVELDQAFTSEDGKPMCIAYGVDSWGKVLYEVDVYESELGPDL